MSCQFYNYLFVVLLFQFLVVFVPLVVFSICFLVTKDFSDLINALLGYTLSMGINGVITDAIKLTVGKLLNFFFRWLSFFLPSDINKKEPECFFLLIDKGSCSGGFGLSCAQGKILASPPPLPPTKFLGQNFIY